MEHGGIKTIQIDVEYFYAVVFLKKIHINTFFHHWQK